MLFFVYYYKQNRKKFIPYRRKNVKMVEINSFCLATEHTWIFLIVVPIKTV